MLDRRRGRWTGQRGVVLIGLMLKHFQRVRSTQILARRSGKSRRTRRVAPHSGRRQLVRMVRHAEGRRTVPRVWTERIVRRTAQHRGHRVPIGRMRRIERQSVRVQVGVHAVRRQAGTWRRSRRRRRSLSFHRRFDSFRNLFVGSLLLLVPLLLFPVDGRRPQFRARRRAGHRRR